LTFHSKRIKIIKITKKILSVKSAPIQESNSIHITIGDPIEGILFCLVTFALFIIIYISLGSLEHGITATGNNLTKLSNFNISVLPE